MIGFLIVHGVLLAGLAAIAALLAWAMARWRLLVDLPNARSSHVAPTPRGGGIGIVVATLVGWLMFWRAGFATRPAGGAEFGLALGALVVALAGLLDDWRAQPAVIKLGAQTLAAALALGGGLVLERVALPGIGTVELGAAGPLISLLWFV